LTLVIISCGGAKADHPAPAFRLYTGAYFKATARYALSRTQPENIRILSAKYGLIKLLDVIEPYDLRLGKPGSITPDRLKEQARQQGLLSFTEIEIVGGADYVALAKEVWPNANPILEGAGWFGPQMKLLKKLSRGYKHGIPIN
jgi:hypothetical protein